MSFRQRETDRERQSERQGEERKRRVAGPAIVLGS